MRAQIKLGKIAGIQIGLHYSWLLIAILIALSMAGQFHAVRPPWSNLVVWTAAIVTAVLFFAALLLHELAHALVAKAKGLQVRSIVLFALGGVSQIESDPRDAKSEFWIAVVGPLTSLAIGLALLLLARVTGWRMGAQPHAPITAVLLWLGYINLLLAAFNMIPGYPLDGGRVLRAIFWGATGSASRSTRLAAQVGQAIAMFFILWGLFRFFLGANLGGLWLAFIGWFLLDAARNSYVQVELTEELRGRLVSDMMDRDCPAVEGQVSVDDFVHEFLLRSGQRCFAVLQGGRMAGLITSNEVKHVERERWAQTSVQAAMRPLSMLKTVTPETPAIQALEIMSRQDLNQLPVLRDGNLAGIFTRRNVVSFLQNHAEINRP